MPELPPSAAWIKPSVTMLMLAALWTWEGLHPFFPLFGQRRDRWRHAGRNVFIAVMNTVVLAVVFGVATVAVANWTTRNEYGLLHLVDWPWGVKLIGAILLLDAWLYVWHRANHRIPLLWRFHRMHHSDRQMDVTTATRFHLGEHTISATLRLGLIPLFGLDAVQIVAYETLVVAITMFHHANISLGAWDRPLRSVIVTPYMHKVHHSRLQPETDSNYSTLFSWWDRLARSFSMRSNCGEIQLGLDEFGDPDWQTLGGMLKTPFVNIRRPQWTTPEERQEDSATSRGTAVSEAAAETRV